MFVYRDGYYNDDEGSGVDETEIIKSRRKHNGLSKLAEYIKEFRERSDWSKDFYDYDKNQFIQQLIEELAPMLDFRNKKMEKLREYLGIASSRKNWDSFFFKSLLKEICLRFG